MKDNIKEILSEAGWYEGREIDIEYMIDELKREGLTIPNILIEELLKEFWNLELNFMTPDERYGRIRLNTGVALGVESKVLIFFEEYINEKLVPVGSIDDESAILFVSYSGKFYMAANGVFFLIGNDFFKGMEAIIYQKNIIRIYPNSGGNVINPIAIG